MILSRGWNVGGEARCVYKSFGRCTDHVCICLIRLWLKHVEDFRLGGNADVFG